MNGKTPISALQELMVARGFPYPVYTETGFGTHFKCTVQAANIVATGMGTSKKAAKHESAKNALELLSGSPPTTRVIVVEKPAPSLPQFRNYVGELNEFASKNRLQYADYALANVALVAYSTQFVYRCTFLTRETLGVGGNKKDAKQEAARKMLDLVKSEPVTFSKAVFLEGEKVEVANKDDIISVFENLKVEKSRVPKRECFDGIPEIETDEDDDLDTLKDKLAKHGILYSVEELQKSPMMVYTKVHGTKLVFLGKGSSREEATKDALKHMLMVAKTGCDMNTDDLISLS